jgi:ubiquinone biosynthesis protein UbiJ
LAGVQALYQLSQEKDRVIRAQGEKIDRFAREVDELRARLARLEQAAR